MLNNLTNFFNLIASKFVKKVPEDTDLIILGTKDSRFGGGYKPTTITVADFKASFQAGNVKSVNTVLPDILGNVTLTKITNVGNTNYNILSDDVIVMLNTAITAPRVFTLPAASSVIPGYEIIIIDEVITVTSTNTLRINVQVGDKLANQLNSFNVMTTGGQFRRLISNGVDNWSYDQGIVRANQAMVLTNKTISYLSNTITNLPIALAWAASDTTTALTVSTSDAIVYVDQAMNVTSWLVSLGTFQTSGSIFTVDIKKNGTSIFSTLVTIDNGEYTSLTAAVPAILNGTVNLAIGDKITTYITQVGDGTAKQLACSLIGNLL